MQNKILKQIPIPFVITELTKPKKHIISEGISKVFGFSEEEFNNFPQRIIRTVFREYYENLKIFRENLKKQKETTVEYWMKDAFNNERYLRQVATPIFENGKMTKIISVFYDLTRQHNLQAMLENANNKFKTLLSISNELIFSLNRSGYFMLLNDGGVSSLGYKTNELIGKHFLEIVAENQKPSIAIAFQKILKSQEAVTFDVNFIDAISREVPFQITAVSLKVGNDITGMIGYGKNFDKIVREERKLKELNEKLVEVNRLLSIEKDRANAQISELEKINEMKNEFISNISHEFRTPLSSIIGFAETIYADEELPYEMVREFNEIIHSEGIRLIKLVDEILDFSKLEEKKVQLDYSKFNLLESIENIVQHFKTIASKKKITFKMDLPEAVFMINADRIRIEKAISNVISNSIKFTLDGGYVQISIKNFLKEIEISIRDNGIGIPENEIDQIFQRFRKANVPGYHRPGAGFGLAFVKQIISLHGGTISVKSKLKVGTEIKIRLPKNFEE